MKLFACVFEGWDFGTDIYNTFLKHKIRKHGGYSLDDFKQDVHERHHNPTVDRSDEPVATDIEGGNQETALYLVTQNVGLLQLKLESIYNVSTKCIDALADDLQFISSSASFGVIRNIVEY